MTSKEYLLSQNQKDIAQWWANVSHDPRFDEIILIMGMDICRMTPIDKIHGAMACLESLKTLADNPDVPPPYPSTGLQFDLNTKKN